MAYLHYQSAPSSLHQFEYAGGLGFRVAVGENVSLRIEGRDLRYKVPLNPVAHRTIGTSPRPLPGSHSDSPVRPAIATRTASR